jgi:hypothetical protein
LAHRGQRERSGVAALSGWFNDLTVTVMLRVRHNKKCLRVRSVRLEAFRFGGGGPWRIAYISLRLARDRLPNGHAVEDMLRDGPDEVLHKPVGFRIALGRPPVLQERGRGGEVFVVASRL